MNKKDKVIKAELLRDPLKPSQNPKRVYLAQFSIIVEEQFVLLPYSAATVWAYAQSFREIQENYKLASDFLFIKRPIAEIMEKIENPDVFGFSTYVWNSNYTDTLARRIKEKYPDCLIVYGGPQIPDKDEQLFFKKPWIDNIGICFSIGSILFSCYLVSKCNDRFTFPLLLEAYHPQF